MPDLTDLIARVESAPLQERLRAKRFHSYGRMPDDEPNYALINPDGPEAADTIAAQKAEIAALRAEVERAQTDECICPKCGIRHGGRHVADAGF